MKNTMTKRKGRNLFLLFSIPALMFLLFGLTMCTSKRMHDKKAIIFTEINSFITDSIVPELKVIREQLDEVLTADELEKINGLRTEAKKIVENGLNIHNRYNELEDKETFAFTDVETNFIKATQKEVRRIITSCWDILDSHESDFEMINKELYTEMQAWHVGLMKTISDNIPFHHGHKKKFHNHSMDINQDELIGTGVMLPVYFILYEPETNFPINVFQEGLEAHKNLTFH